MSAAEATTVPPARPAPSPARPRLSTRFLRSELRLVFGRRRNQAGLAVLAAVPVLIAVAVHLSHHQDRGGGPDFFSSITDNGLFVALAALTVESGLFLPLAISCLAADAVAGEANTGTLRYLLTVPVRRTRLLLVKYAAVVIGAFVGTLVITMTGVVVGLLIFGGGPLTTLSGVQIPFWAGLGRVLLAAAYLALMMSSLGAVGLFVSTLTEQPIAAIIATVIFSSASFILDSIPQVAFVHPFLLTHHWLDFGDLLRSPMAWSAVGQGLYVAAAYVVVFLALAWARFSGKDVTS